MRDLLLFLVVSGAMCAESAPAYAGLSLGPSDTVFQLNGKVGLEYGECYISMTGKTSSTGSKGPAGYITAAALSKTTKKCNDIAFIGLPWSINITSKHGGNISGISYIENGRTCPVPPDSLRIYKNDDWAVGGPGSICLFLFGIKPTPAVIITR